MVRPARRWSRATRLSLTLATPRTEPVRHVLVGDTTTVVELYNPVLNLVELPALRLDVCRNRVGGEKRLRATDALRERASRRFFVSVSMRTESVVVL